MKTRMPLLERAAVKSGVDPKRRQPRSVGGRRHFLLAHWDAEPQAWIAEVRKLEHGSPGSTRHSLGTPGGMSAIALAGHILDSPGLVVRSMETSEVGWDLKIERQVSFF